MFFVITVYAMSMNAAVPDTLLIRIQDRMASYRQDSSYTCVVHSTIQKMNRHWQPMETTKIEKELTVESGQPSIKIISAVRMKDDETADITDEVREEMGRSIEEDSDNEDDEGGKQELSLNQEDIFPFGEERKTLFTFHMLPDTTVRGEQILRLQTRAIDPAEDLYNGIYWIHPETGSVHEVYLTPSKYPKFVKQLSMHFIFKELPEDRWKLEKISTRVYVNLLIKKIRIETEESYSEYRFPE